MGQKGRRKCVLVCLLALLVLAWGMVEKASQPEAVTVTQLVSWGTRGDLVRQTQEKLRQLGYYPDTPDGIYGTKTYEAIRQFQADNGLKVDGIAGSDTLSRLGISIGTGTSGVGETGTSDYDEDLYLLASIIHGEARGEPYEGQVAVGAAISYVDKKAVIDYDKCKGCGRCIGACSFDAVYNPNSSANELLDRKMAEYAQAVCHGSPCFHISLVQDISPNCDCHGENDAPILPDIGMVASFDPVALDQACADACLKATPIENSQLGEHLAEPGWHCHHDHFKDSNPNIEWEATLDQAEKIGLGTRQYELKRIK